MLFLSGLVVLIVRFRYSDFVGTVYKIVFVFRRSFGFDILFWCRWFFVDIDGRCYFEGEGG